VETYGLVLDVGSITVVSTRFMLVWGTATAGSWVWLVVRSVRRRRTGRPARRLRGAAAVGLIALLTLALAADGVNSYFSYLPNVSDVADAITQTPPPPLSTAVRLATAAPPAAGKLATLPVPSTTGFKASRAWVWLPPQYFTQPRRRFPVVYLFHGSPGVQKDWFHGGEAARTGAALARAGWPAILVAPQMSRNWLDDSECVDGVHERVETHLLRAVIPAADAALRTIPSRLDRVFAGMSAGGYCALNLGLRNRFVAATILDFSGFTEPTHSGGLKALFGRNSGLTAAANNPATYARSLTSGPAMRVWLDSGSDDRQVKREITSMAATLRADQMTVQLHSRPGGHTYSVWRPALSQSLSWALPLLPQS
jgi:enterochelin esterase-like enzyme